MRSLARMASRAGLPLTAEVVEDDDLALCQGEREHLLDIEREEFAIDGASNDTLLTQAAA
ncbi:hypothetical protein [Bradyrhizobium murdochi]|uniref:hypothetical protein n=1 Tax=Bradyrhizobium murdochi TaxID=1038859 RepID=UPI00040B64A5|nr:hypothetical protein [Bradyrhizobium murdochi]